MTVYAVMSVGILGLISVPFGGFLRQVFVYYQATEVEGNEWSRKGDLKL